MPRFVFIKSNGMVGGLLNQRHCPEGAFQVVFSGSMVLLEGQLLWQGPRDNNAIAEAYRAGAYLLPRPKIAPPTWEPETGSITIPPFLWMSRSSPALAKR